MNYLPSKNKHKKLLIINYGEKSEGTSGSSQYVKTEKCYNVCLNLKVLKIASKKR